MSNSGTLKGQNTTYNKNKKVSDSSQDSHSYHFLLLLLLLLLLATTLHRMQTDSCILWVFYWGPIGPISAEVLGFRTLMIL